MSKIKVAVMSDSPKIHTGFGVVNERLCMGFHEAGFDVHAIGFMDTKPNSNGRLPYSFYPTTPFDELGHKTFGIALRRIEPDVIFILTDPGNLWYYMNPIATKLVADWNRDGRQYRPPVVSYTPIEGSPSPYSHGESLSLVEEQGGTCVMYCETARKVIIKEFPNLSPEIVHHGLDHAPFQRYSDEDRKTLRRLVGLDNFFVIGNVGVNKRTKGFTTLIYAAEILRKEGLDEGIKFYCHTNPVQDTMYGYKLKDLAKQHGVADMFLWKQEVKFSSSYWMGVERDTGTLESAREIAGKIPESPEGRGLLWAGYDYVSKMNCLDLYVDASQCEGWGLCTQEAMACGVPAISVKDQHVREELHRGASFMIETTPLRTWDTWHSGMRLVGIDPAAIALAIIKMKDSPYLRECYSTRGMNMASDYRWENSQEEMSRIVKETYERHIEQWQK